MALSGTMENEQILVYGDVFLLPNVESASNVRTWKSTTHDHRGSRTYPTCLENIVNVFLLLMIYYLVTFYIVDRVNRA